MSMRRTVSHMIIVLVALAAAGCGRAAPQVKVIGVSDAQARPSASQRTMVVFLEVVNPTNVDLKLSRLEYQLSAGPWLTTEGKIALHRAVGAGSSTVVEVPVQLSPSARAVDVPDGPVSYSLAGRLFALTDRTERSWSVVVHGVLQPEAFSDLRRAVRARMRIANSD
jgi:hypothetical protein